MKKERCKAVIEFGEGKMQRHQCQLSLGHKGQHKVTGQVNWREYYTLTWWEGYGSKETKKDEEEICPKSPIGGDLP